MLLCDQLSRLVALYPEAGHNSGSIRVVAEEWAALLKREEASTTEFIAAMEVVKRRCRFFPTPHDLAEALQYVREHPPRIDEARRLPEPPPGGMSDEKRERLRRAIDIIRRQISGPREHRLRPDEARRRINALGLR